MDLEIGNSLPPQQVPIINVQHGWVVSSSSLVYCMQWLKNLRGGHAPMRNSTGFGDTFHFTRWPLYCRNRKENRSSQIVLQAGGLDIGRVTMGKSLHMLWLGSEKSKWGWQHQSGSRIILKLETHYVKHQAFLCISPRKMLALSFAWCYSHLNCLFSKSV